MSKNFAEEYKALANEELPELWNRIEAGLTPKTTAPAEKVEEVLHTVKAESTEEVPSQLSKGKVISFLRRYRTVVAAAVCVVVILPAMMVIGRAGQKSFSGGAITEDTAKAPSADITESCDEAPAEEPASTETEMWTADEGAESAAAVADEESEDAAENTAEAATATQEFMDREAGQAAGAAEKESSSDGAITEMGSVLAEEEKAEEDEQKKMDSRGESSFSESMKDSQGKTYEKITIKVTEQVEGIAETDEGLYCGVKAKVVRDPSGELDEGTQITIWVSLSSSVAYVLGEEYELDLSYDSDRECPYRVTKNYFS